MLQKATRLTGRKVVADDGEVGPIEDLYFDDERWGVRYLVVSTGGWLNGRSVLIPPAAVRSDLSTDDTVRVGLTRQQVENSPPMDTEKPVSRLYEMAHAAYYQYPHYWVGAQLWGQSAYPFAWSDQALGYGPDVVGATPEPGAREAAQEQFAAADASHLRSAREVIGYGVEATDGSVGRVDDLLIDDKDWSVHDLVVDTRQWLPGGHVLVPSQSVQNVEWAASRVQVKQDRESVKHGDPFH